MSEDKRITKADLPTIDQLPRYGGDVPTPTCIEELVCVYNEDDRTPLVFTELEGYCIPPEGIIKVWVNGVGSRAGAGPMMYPPGTFREDKHTIGKELGVTPAEITVARHTKRKEEVVNALATFFKDKEGIAFDELKDKDSQVLAAMVAYTFEMIDANKSSRDLVNFTKYYWDKMDNENKIIDRWASQEGKAVEVVGKSMDVMAAYLKQIEKDIAKEKDEVVNVELFDVSGESDSAEDI